jgi:hypothetical protein
MEGRREKGEGRREGVAGSETASGLNLMPSKRSLRGTVGSLLV